MRVISVSLVAALLVGVAEAPAVAAAADLVRVIVGLAGGADPAAVVGGAGPWRAVAGLPAITVDLPSDQVDATFTRWSTNTSVRYSVRDSTVHADTVADPSDVENLQNLRAFQVLGARTWTTGSSAITVAVVDTGVTPNPDLSADRIVAGYDFADGDADPADDDNHGTLVATTIGALGGNGRGATGVCDQCRIMPVRVLRHTGADTKATGYSSDVAAGIVWAADHGAQIVNVSASTNVSAPLLKEAVDYATGKNVLVVASAGHDDESPGHTPTPYIGYPAAFGKLEVYARDLAGNHTNWTRTVTVIP